MDVTTAAAAGTVTIGGDIIVNRLGYGAMRLCGKGVWGWPEDRENALRVLRRAIELDVNFIDTADAYGPEVNEEQIAQALYPYPPGLLIATKGGSTRSGPGQWGRDCRPERLKRCCEDSLRRLRLDVIDLYQLHAVDPAVPWIDQAGTLRDLQEAGKIRHAGLSNVSLDQLRQAQTIVKIVSVQNRYNMDERGQDDPIVDYCETEGIAFIPWFPLGAGDVADKRAALGWLLARSATMLPIPGTQSLRHLEENVAAAAAANTQ